MSKQQLGSKQRSQIMLAWILDGDWHWVSEFYALVTNSMDPARAVKAHLSDNYHIRFGSGKLPTNESLDYQVARGKLRLFQQMLRGMENVGYVEVKKDMRSPSDPNKWQVRLLEAGHDRIRKSGRWGIWSTFRMLIESGKIRMLTEAAERGVIVRPKKEELDAPNGEA